MYCHCNVKTGTRASGQSAAAKYDYISRGGKYEAASQDEVVHIESGCMPAFASSDARLYWAAADSHERSNGRLFRSLTAALPNTLDAPERLELSRRFAAQVTGGELPYTLALHAGRSKQAGAADNPHLHLVFSERVNDGVARGAEQWFRRAAPKQGDPSSGGARKTERTKPRAWLEETRSAWAGEMNLAFTRAGVDDRVTAESHATQLARARAAGDTAAEARLLLNPPSSHIGPPAKHSWEDRPGRAEALKLDRYVAAEAAAASAEAVRSAHAPAVAEAAEARSRVAALDARIAALEAAEAAGERRAKLAAREASVRATSQGGQWLEEAHESVLARAGGCLTVGERERAVETVEGRLRANLAAREESLMATSTGSTLLGEEYGEGVAAAAPRQSFAERESVLERVAQRVDEELGAREEALRSIPPGRHHLPAAEQARAGGAGEPPTPAERESMVRASEQRVGEELDRRKERVLAGTGDDRLLVEADEALTARGAIRGDGGLTEQARVIERAEDLLEGERAELELKEGDLLKDAAGEELLRNARRDVLAAAGREAPTLADGWAVIEQATAAKARVEALGVGGLDLYHAHLADIDPGWGVDGNVTTTRGNQDAALSAAESDGGRLGRLGAVLSDEAAAARYREVLDDSPVRFDTAALDRALAAGERERAAAARRAELDRREERVLADTGDNRLLVEADEELTERGAISGDGGLAEQAQIIERAEELLAVDLADLELEEAELRKDAAGEELLRNARRDVLVAAGREAPTLADGWAVIEQATAAKARVKALGVGGLDLYHAHLADIDPKWVVDGNAPTPRGNQDAALSTAESDGARLERLGAVLSDEAAAARYRADLDASPVRFGTAALDRALAAGEREREERAAARRAAALETATEAAQAAASRSNVELPPAGVRAIYETGETHAAGLAAVERTTQALDAAADQRLPARTVIDAWNANRTAPGGIAAALDAATTAAARREEERAAAARRAAALETATEAAQAAASRSNVELPPAGVRAIYETGETHAAGLAAVERTTEALADAADQQLPARTVIDAWNANRTAPGGIAAALDAATAAARREEERAAAARRQAAIEQRSSRVKQLLADPASADALIEAIEAGDPSWRTRTSPSCIDRALDAAERAPGRREVATRRHQEHQVVLETERRFPDVPSAAFQGVGGRFDVTTEAGRAGRRVSQDLSDRALVRTFAAEQAEPPAPRNLVQRLYDWLRTRIERLFGRSSGPSAATAAPGPQASAARPAEAGRPSPTAFEERYCRKWPGHAADIHRPDFKELAAGASGRNRLFERREPYSSRWTTVDPGELPAALAKPSPAWSDKAVEAVTRRVGGWDPDRTERRRVAEAHLGDYENRLPAEYSHSAEWRAILKRAEAAVSKVQNGLRYRWADRWKDDRKKRELEATAINRACGRDARRLHEKMLAAREAVRPDWEVTVRIRTVQQLIRNEEATRFKQEQARQRAREQALAAARPPVERKQTRDPGRGR